MESIFEIIKMEENNIPQISDLSEVDIEKSRSNVDNSPKKDQKNGEKIISANRQEILKKIKCNIWPQLCSTRSSNSTLKAHLLR